MSAKTCDVDGCDRFAVKRGWCDMHYRRQLRKGSLGDAAPSRLPAHSPCRVIGCEDPNEGRGLCHRHYQAWWAGTPAGIKSRPSSNVGSVARPFSLDATAGLIRVAYDYLVEWQDPTFDELVAKTPPPVDLGPFVWEVS